MTTPPTKLPWIAAALSLALGLLAAFTVFMMIRSRNEMAHLKSQAAAARAERDAVARLPAAITTKPDPADAATTNAATPNPSDVTSESTDIADTSTTTNETPGRQRNRNAEDMAAMLNSPMMKQIMASQTATMMKTTFGHLMDRFELAPDERDHLLGLLVEKQTNLQNLGIQLMNPTLTEESRAAIIQQLSEAWTNGETKIREFLNDDADFAYYQTYSQQEPERREIGMFEAALPEGNTLSPATADSLAALQNEARKAFPFTVDFYDQQNFGNPAVLNTASVQRFLEEQARFQSQVAEQAASLLPPDQLALYKQNQSAVRQMSAMQLNSIVQLAGGGQ